MLNSIEASYSLKARNMGESLTNLHEFSSQYQSICDLLNKTVDSVERAAGGHIIFCD
jgi:hypothetical protein